MLHAAPPSAISASSPQQRRLVSLTVAMLAIAAATILGALGFEHLGGYLPCHLCLMQRTPYYVGMPIAAIALLSIRLGASRQLLAALLAIFALLMLYNMLLAGFHAGVEWKLWEGPASCAPSTGVGSAADMLDQLQNTTAPSCTEAALRIAGLSLAGWNVPISALLAGLAIAAARLAWRRG